MQVKRSELTPTRVKLTISADKEFLDKAKEFVVNKLGANVKVAGFREGKAPSSIIEKNIDQSQLQNTFIEESINSLFSQVVDKEKLRPVGEPKVELKKFVPYSTLDFDVEIEVVGKIKLADYKKVKKEKVRVKLTEKEVNGVVSNLQTRSANRNEVTRPAKNGDELLIDFKGTDVKKNPVQGADGVDYPLLLGSNAFIPGFESNLIGLKSGQKKTFDVIFPKDYGVKALANKKVTFNVTVKKVSEVKLPELDDKFASQAGPFKTLKELNADIKKQLTIERQNEADRIYENELLQEVSSKSEVDLPKQIVDEQITRGEQQEKQDLTYKGQTWQEHLAEEGVSEEEHRERNRKSAEEAVKAGIILSEIAEIENIVVTPEELEVRIQVLKAQYKDVAMQTELDKPENRRDIANRIITEKTLAKLVEYSSN